MPLAAGYKFGIALRGVAYRKGWFKTNRLSRPVVSIGNLTVGGTGKTPLVAHLAERLLALGWKPSILSRGYGRRSGAKLIAVEPASGRAPDPREIGDEPALLACKLPEVPIVVGSDRYRAGRLAESRFGVDVHILDDGFQHLALARDVNIVVLDATQKLAEDALLPAGRLREPLAALKRANFAVLSRTEFDALLDAEGLLNKANPQMRIFRSRTRLAKILDVAQNMNNEPEAWKGRRVLAFCGIGNARAFFDDARKWGLSLVAEKAFRDHHVYTRAELDRLSESARAMGASALITTEKDIMNLPPGWKPQIPLGACVIQTELREPEAFEIALLERLKSAKESN
jgi:tetraacyldisaccharide 4'-kinase